MKSKTIVCTAALAFQLVGPAGPRIYAQHSVQAGADYWENHLRPAVVESDKPIPHWALSERMAFYHVPGVAVAVLKDGKVVRVTGYGVLAAGTSERAP